MTPQRSLADEVAGMTEAELAKLLGPARKTR
jgi:hypothetical protein